MDEVSQKLQANNANIKVFGIGGGGLNAINNMIASGLQGQKAACKASTPAIPHAPDPSSSMAFAALIPPRA